MSLCKCFACMIVDAYDSLSALCDFLFNRRSFYQIWGQPRCAGSPAAVRYGFQSPPVSTRCAVPKDPAVSQSVGAFSISVEVSTLKRLLMAGGGSGASSSSSTSDTEWTQEMQRKIEAAVQVNPRVIDQVSNLTE